MPNIEWLWCTATLAIAAARPALAATATEPQAVAVPVGLELKESWAQDQRDRCVRQGAKACSQLAFAFRSGRAGVAADLNLAVQLYARSWWLRSSRDTSVAIYEVAPRLAKLEPATLRALRFVCDRGSHNVCAATTLHRLAGARTRDQQRPLLAALERSCEAGADRACYDLSAVTGHLRDRYPWYFDRR